MKPNFFLTAALLITSNVAFAGVTAESIAADLQAQGYTRVEIKQGPSQIKAEATRGTERLEAVYDAASGDVLTSHVRGIGSDDSTRAGVSVRTRERDFVRASENGDLDEHSESDDRKSGRSGDDDNETGSDDGARSGSDDHGKSDHGDHDSDGDGTGGDHDSGGNGNGGDHDSGGDNDNGKDD